MDEIYNLGEQTIEGALQLWSLLEQDMAVLLNPAYNVFGLGHACTSEGRPRWWLVMGTASGDELANLRHLLHVRIVRSDSRKRYASNRSVEDEPFFDEGPEDESPPFFTPRAG